MTPKRWGPGRLCKVIGLLLVAAAVALVVYNSWDNSRAAASAQHVLEEMSQQSETRSAPEPGAQGASNVTEPAEMDTITVDSNEYIGTLQIPALGLDLPIMSDWNYAKLRIAPCRYQGTPQGRLVLAAHNYQSHFGKLDQLRPGDTVTFTDVEGNVFRYAVAEIEVLQPTAIDQMISGDWDLTLFTCTLSGRTRLTVRCRRAAEIS